MYPYRRYNIPNRIVLLHDSHHSLPSCTHRIHIHDTLERKLLERFIPAVTFVGTVVTKYIFTVCATFSGTALDAHMLITLTTVFHWIATRAVFSMARSTVVQILNSFFSLTFVAEESSTDIATEVLQAI